MFEQMHKGGWVDDHGHSVCLNKAMCDLMPIVQDAIDYRARAIVRIPAGDV